MKKVILILTILILVTCTSKTKSKVELRFEDFKWGSNIEEVEAVIVSKGHKAIRGIYQDHVGYVDEILNERVTVGFYFTPKTQKLYMIGLLWRTNLVSGRLLKLIEEKYGLPIVEVDNMKKYQLGDSIILLETGSLDTVLGYYSSKYKNINKQESEGS